MIENFKEAFEKTKIAGSIASGALDEVSKILKPGTTLDLINLAKPVKFSLKIGFFL